MAAEEAGGGGGSSCSTCNGTGKISGSISTISSEPIDMCTGCNAWENCTAITNQCSACGATLSGTSCWLCGGFYGSSQSWNSWKSEHSKCKADCPNC